jgi:hypothetical protein
VIAIGNSHLLGIFTCNFQHIFSIGGVDVCGSVLLGNGDTENAVTGSNVEHLLSFATLTKFSSHNLCGHLHERHHRLCKFHPIGIFGLQSSFAEGSASSLGGE